MRNVKIPEEIVDFIKEKYGDNILYSEIRERVQGLSENIRLKDIWITVKREIFKDLVKTLHKEIDFLHISVISPVDMGETIEVVYHFAVYYGIPEKECIINIKVILPKDDLTIPTITDILPGALFSELDLKHMMGIDVIGLKDEGPLFLPDEFPKDFYPWRKDEKNIDNYITKEFTINSEGSKDGNL